MVYCVEPEQIANRLPLDFPDDKSMRISHEAIYQSLYIEGRGALKRELVATLRTGRALRKPQARTHSRPHGHVTDEVVICQRPAEAADRAVPGHWEGDLIIGTGRSAIGTVVERSSRAIFLVHLSWLEGWGETPRIKNGPALGGHGAEAMNMALQASMTRLPLQLRKNSGLGSRHRTGCSRGFYTRYRHSSVLCRSAFTLAAPNQ